MVNGGGLSLPGFPVHSRLIKLLGVKKIGCQKAENAIGYNCDYEIDASNDLQGESKYEAHARFVSDDGWQVAN